jgi:tape measure domain-containing protein
LIEVRERGAKATGDALEHVGRSGQQMGRHIESGANMGSTAVAGLTKMLAPLMAALAALKVAETALSFNNMQQQSEMAFETMLGSAAEAKQMVADIVQFAANTPFEIKGLTESAQKLLAFGFESKDVLPMLQTVGDAMAGLGRGEEGINRATLALGQMAARGKVTGEEMMQLTELGIPAWQALADAIGTDTGTAMDMVTKGMVSAETGINAVLDVMDAKFGGLMEKQAQTLGGLASTIKDTFAVTIGTIAEPAVERLTAAMAGLAAYTETDQFQGFVAGAQGAVEGIFQFIEGIGSVLQDGLSGEQIATAVEGWAEAFTSWAPEAMAAVGERLDELISAVGDWIGENGAYISDKMTSEWAPAAAQWVTEAAVGMVAQMPEILAGMAQWVEQTGFPAAQNFGANLGQGIATGFVEGLKNTLPNIKDAMSTWWSDITAHGQGRQSTSEKEWAKQFNLAQAIESGVVTDTVNNVREFEEAWASYAAARDAAAEPEPVAAMAPPSGASPSRLERGHIALPGGGFVPKEPKAPTATRETAAREAQTAIMGFVDALEAGKSDMLERYGQLGADSATALAKAMADNTATAGSAVAKSMEGLVSQMQTAGVEDWRQLGDDLAGAFHDALIERTPEAQSAAMAMLQAVTAEIAGAKMATAINEATDKASTAMADATAKADEQMQKLTDAYDHSESIRSQMDRMNDELKAGTERMQATQQRMTDQISAGRGARDQTRDYGRQDLLTAEQRAQAQADLEKGQQRRMADLQRDYQRKVADITARGGAGMPQALAEAARAYQQQVADQAAAAAAQKADMAERIALEDANRARQRQWAAEDAAQRLADVAADKERAAANAVALEAEKERLKAPIARLELQEKERGLAERIAEIRKTEADQLQRANDLLAEQVRLQEQLYAKATGGAAGPGGDEAGAAGFERDEIDYIPVNMDGEQVATIVARRQMHHVETATGVSGGA